MKDNNLDRHIKDTYIEFSDEMDMHSNIEVPDFNIVMNKFHNNLNQKNKTTSISKRIALAASFTIVAFIVTFLSSLPRVSAFKSNTIKSFDVLRENTKNIKISINDNTSESN